MKKLVIQFIRFAGVGVSAFCIDYVLFLLLTHLGVPYLAANLVSYTLANIYEFCMTMRFVFAGREGQKRYQQVLIYAVLAVAALCLNELLLWALVSFVLPIPQISKVLSTLLVALFNFFTRKFAFEDSAPTE